jgi:hypothetical protein
MSKKILFIGLFLLSMVCVSVVSATDYTNYTNWVNEYDGTESATRYLWNFNSDEISGTVPYGRADNLAPGGPDPKAILYNNATFGTGGKFEYGGHLTGVEGTQTGDQLYVGTLGLSSGISLTVETWVKFNDFSTYQVLADKMRADNAGFKLQYNKDTYGDRVVFFVGDGSAQQFVSGTISLETDQWYHIAGTWDEEDEILKVFVDGVEINSKTVVDMSYSDNATRNFTIGSREYYKSYTVNGTMDGVRISDTAIDFIPEPATLTLLGIGLVALRSRTRKKD